MKGTNANTGFVLDGKAHLKQSLECLLSTPLNTRIMRRDYGSALFDLIDKPQSDSTKLDIISATATAIAAFEPRFLLTKVELINQTSSSLLLSLHGSFQSKTVIIVVDV